MQEFFFHQIMCILFVGVYFIVSMYGVKKTCFFWGISEVFLVLCFVKALIGHDGNLIAIIIYQIFLLLIIKIHYQNKQRNEIYNMMSSGKYTVVVFSGIRNLSENEYEKLKVVLEKMFDREIELIGKVYLFLSYEDKKITIRYIFNRSQDYEVYVKELIDTIDMKKLEETEYIGKGASMIVEYSIS